MAQVMEFVVLSVPTDIPSPSLSYFGGLAGGAAVSILTILTDKRCVVMDITFWLLSSVFSFVGTVKHLLEI